MNKLAYFILLFFFSEWIFLFFFFNNFNREVGQGLSRCVEVGTNAMVITAKQKMPVHVTSWSLSAIKVTI